MTKIPLLGEITSASEAATILKSQEAKACPVVSDAINHPSHYNQGKIEVIEFIEDQKLGYHIGNAVKYLCRAGRKDESKTIEDLKKSIWYINREIERLTAAKDGREAVRPNDMPKQNEKEGNHGLK